MLVEKGTAVAAKVEVNLLVHLLFRQPQKTDYILDGVPVTYRHLIGHDPCFDDGAHINGLAQMAVYGLHDIVVDKTGGDHVDRGNSLAVHLVQALLHEVLGGLLAENAHRLLEYVGYEKPLSHILGCLESLVQCHVHVEQGPSTEQDAIHFLHSDNLHYLVGEPVYDEKPVPALKLFYFGNKLGKDFQQFLSRCCGYKGYNAFVLVNVLLDKMGHRQVGLLLQGQYGV